MAQRKFIQIYSFGSGVDFTPVVASLQAYILLQIKLIHRPLFQHDSAHCRAVSLFHFYESVKNTWDLSKIRGIIRGIMQLNFDKRAMR